MNLLLEITIKVSSIVLLALATTLLLRRRSAALRHWLLSASLLCAAAVPLLQPFVSFWTLPVSAPAFRAAVEQPPAAAAALPAASLDRERVAGAPLQARPSLDAGRTVLWLWAFGAAVGLIGLAIGFARLAWLESRSTRLSSGRWTTLAGEIARANGLSRPVTLLQSEHPALLVTWGFRRPRVILPASAGDWPDDRVRVVLLHEIAHIRRGDWITQLAAECLRAVYWFNPLVWVASRRLRQESEHACDDAVLNGGVEGSEYATHLLALARLAARRRQAFTGFPAPAMARPSSLERRFSAMLNDQLNRTPITTPARLVTTAAIAIATVLVAGLSMAQTFSTFSGSVFDSTNRVLPNVTLVLQNTQTTAKYEIKSDRNGRFEFVGLPPGEYSWQTALAGFADLKGTVSVAGRNVQRDLTLQVGSLQETISVKGGGSAQAQKRVSVADVEAIRRKQDESICPEGASPAPGAVGGNIKPPRKLVDVRPNYPLHLSASAIGGVVELNAVIDTRGDVSEVTVLKSPNPDLEVAAMEAVKQWQFTSTVLNCAPVEVKMRVLVNFVAE